MDFDVAPMITDNVHNGADYEVWVVLHTASQADENIKKYFASISISY